MLTCNNFFSAKNKIAHDQDDSSPFIPAGYLFDFLWIYDRQHRFHCASELS